jgi:murein L,D-transpeptidase YcbB/YkuD
VPASPPAGTARRRSAIGWLCAGLLAVLSCAASAAQPVADALQARLAAADSSLYATQLLRALYAPRAYRPLWTGQRTEEARAALASAAAHGLSTANYHRSAIEAHRADATPDGQAALELLISDGLLLLGSHLRSGRMEPGTLTPRRQLLAVDADLPARLAGADSAAAFLDGLVSPLAGYARLQSALVQYRHLADAGGWPSLPDGPTLHPGDRAAAVTALRARLAREGMDGPVGAGGELFDAPLEAAVRRFQARHGLDVDGAVGRQTRLALNTPASARVGQIVANLERRRWLGEAPGRRQVRVNVAAFTLEAVEGPEVALRMRVIVGRPYRPTPEFADRIRYLVLNPYWEVPPKLAVQDKLPLIRRDPGYLAREHMRVLRGWGEQARELDPAQIDWWRVKTPLPFRLRQDPGPWNALGRIKFMFPNVHDVYLHDTPARELFAHAERGFSSGCIRVEQPLALADWLLADDPQWSPQALRAAIDSGQTRTVNLRQPVPVYLLYWTAWVDGDGVVQFRRDIYERDAPLAAALAAPLENAENSIPGSFRLAAAQYGLAPRFMKQRPMPSIHVGASRPGWSR